MSRSSGCGTSSAPFHYLTHLSEIVRMLRALFRRFWRKGGRTDDLETDQADLGASAWDNSSARSLDKVDATSAAPAEEPLARKKFDEELYLLCNPDVACTIEEGSVASGWEHWLIFGAEEEKRGLRPSIFRDEVYSDVVRQSEPDSSQVIESFDVAEYIYTNPDVGIVLGKDFESCRAHWVSQGRGEGRYGPGARLFANRRVSIAKLLAKPFGINIYGPFAAISGLGTAARNILAAIRASGIPYETHVFDLSLGPARITSQASRRAGAYRVNLLLVNADQIDHFVRLYPPGYFDSGYNIAVWAWELAAFRPDWYGYFGAIDEVWSHSDFSSASIGAIACVPVRRVPLPVIVDTEKIDVGAARDRFGIPRDSFVFLSVFDTASTLARKNPLAVLKAFREAFSNSADTFLVIKFLAAESRPALERQLNSAMAGLDNTLVVGECLSGSDMNLLRAASDCLVSAHRSEGFGLNIAEFMALGKPAVATNYSGNLEFFDETTGYPVAYDLVEIEESARPYMTGYVWAEPDAASLIEQMKAARFNREERERRGAAAALRMKNFSSATIGGLIATRLRDLDLEAPAPEFTRLLGASRRARTLSAIGTLSVETRAELDKLPYKPRLSLVVPLRSRGVEFLHGRIASALGQTYPFWELCVCETGSADAETRALIDTNRGRDARLKISRLAAEGEAAGESIAAEIATGEFLIFVDDDVELAEDALMKIACAANADRLLGCLYADEGVTDLGNGPEDRIDDRARQDLPHAPKILVVRKGVFLALRISRLETRSEEKAELMAQIRCRTDKIQSLPRSLYRQPLPVDPTSIWEVPRSNRPTDDFSDPMLNEDRPLEAHQSSDPIREEEAAPQTQPSGPPVAIAQETASLTSKEAEEMGLLAEAFDPAFYLDTYKDVASDGLDPVRHYVVYGWREGRNPHRYFDTNYYLANNPDVARANVNPYFHYLEHGALEGRNPSPDFDSSWYLAQIGVTTPRSGVNPLVHFLREGQAKGISPKQEKAILAEDFSFAPEICENWANQLFACAVKTVTPFDPESVRVIVVSSPSMGGKADDRPKSVRETVDGPNILETTWERLLGEEANDKGSIFAVTDGARSGTDIFLFCDETDQLDARFLPFALAPLLTGAKVVLFDLVYESKGRNYPVLQPGPNWTYIESLDAVFSRFLITADLLSALLKAHRPAAPYAILQLALQHMRNAKEMRGLSHAPFPLLRTSDLSDEIRRRRTTLVKSASARRMSSGGQAWAAASVVICTKDKGHLLAQLIDSILGYPPSVVADVAIVVNQPENDFARAYHSELQTNPRLKIINYDRRYNFSEQCNIGARATSGELVLFLNDDIVPIGKSWLEELARPFADPRVAVTGPLLLYPDELVQHAGLYLGFANCAGHTLRHASLPQGDYLFMASAPRQVSAVTGAVLLTRRSVFEQVNGFDRQLATYLQDVDYCLRVMNLDMDIVFNPNAALIHMESVSMKKLTERDNLHSQRSLEQKYFTVRFGQAVRRDPYHNPNFDVADERLQTLALRPDSAPRQERRASKGKSP